MCQIWYAYVKVVAQTQSCQKTFKFDLRSNVKVMNVHDTSSHGDTSMCQYPYFMPSQKAKKLRLGHKNIRRERRIQG